jgi:hypothetical protein
MCIDALDRNESGFFERLIQIIGASGDRHVFPILVA